MKNTKIPVILDTDIGSDIDDTWALAMLLESPELDLKLIVTACGDTHYRARLTAKFLEVAGRTDVPIGIGISDPDGEQYEQKFQEPWLAGFNVDEYKGRIHENGVQALLDVIDESPETVTINSIAATTNIARALELRPEIARKCRFVGMHGSINLGWHGTPGAIAETNVRLDVPAFRKVLAAPWLEKIITPLDTCGLVILDRERFQRIRQAQKPLLKALIENYEIWAQRVTWFKVEYTQTRSSTLFDTVAVYLAYSNEFLRIQSLNLAVDDSGLTLLDPAGQAVQVALEWRDYEAFCDHLLARLNRASQKI